MRCADCTSSAVTAVVGIANDAVYANAHIPSEMSAYEATYQFCPFTFWPPERQLARGRTKPRPVDSLVWSSIRIRKLTDFV
jgi:hypothetical protein